tara:strand:- start:599 stop:1060 length:462 start_codon:yes stop_codon:yes gene_type:complete
MVIQLKNLVPKEHCECGGDCCSVNESTAVDIAKSIITQNEAVAGYEKALKKMLDFMKKSSIKQYKRSYPKLYQIKSYMYPAHLKKGPKFDRIVNVRADNPSKADSVHFFVDKSNGDIYKPAGYNGRAKGVRGNIFKPKTYARFDVHGGWLYRR